MKKLSYIIVLLFWLIAGTVFGQCPPNTWGLEVNINPDQYPEETSWYIMDFYGDTLMSGGTYDNIVDYQPQYHVNCAPIDSFFFTIKDSYGDGMQGSLWGGEDGSVYITQCNDTIWSLDSANFGSILIDTIVTSNCPPPPPVFGCMDNDFIEYNFLATVDTGLCLTPVVFGCTDSLAYNYIDSANTNIDLANCTNYLTLTDLAGNGWAGSSLIISQATNLSPPFMWAVVDTFTLIDGFDTTYSFNLQAGYTVKAVLEITYQSDFTAVQCGYELYSLEGGPVISQPGGFASPVPPFMPIFGEPYCGNNCIERTFGCIDSLAVNYIDSVNTDDGSCYYNPGCTNPLYLEYDAAYDYNDNSCATLIVYGCMDTAALNYEPLANVEIPNSCVAVVEGCMNELAFNYNPNANVADTCIAVVEGCMIEEALNYDSTANVNDGSCVLPVLGCVDPNAFNFNPLANVDDGTCIAFSYGCTDPTAFNYCDTCNTENGSCIEIINGCIDSTALNYNPLANTDNSSCIYPLPGCTDPTAINYNVEANVPDSSCYYSAGCNSGDIYYIPNACFEWVVEVDPYCCDDNWDNTCSDLYVYCENGWTGPVSVIERSNAIIIYPNPTSDYINISKKVDIRVFNIVGKLIASEKQINTLDVSSFNSGIYNVVLEYNNKIINKKIIKK
mgnify:CR=1 FL=1